ncbi:MAG: hypothetical protein QME07_07090 [bacterium]|nr:hypothetical protein [bacterium]
MDASYSSSLSGGMVKKARIKNPRLVITPHKAILTVNLSVSKLPITASDYVFYYINEHFAYLFASIVMFHRPTSRFQSYPLDFPPPPPVTV